MSVQKEFLEELKKDFSFPDLKNQFKVKAPVRLYSDDCSQDEILNSTVRSDSGLDVLTYDERVLDFEKHRKDVSFRIDYVSFTVKSYVSMVKLLSLLKEEGLWVLPGTVNGYTRKAFFLEGKAKSCGSVVLVEKAFDVWKEEEHYRVTFPGEVANAFFCVLFTNSEF